MHNKVRLIDANALKAEFTGNFQDEYPIAMIKAYIDTAPTIEAEPVRHGHWIPVNPCCCLAREFKCSSCGKSVYYDHDTSCCYDFCPNCGSKMDRGGDS